VRVATAVARQAATWKLRRSVCGILAALAVFRAIGDGLNELSSDFREEVAVRLARKRIGRFTVVADRNYGSNRVLFVMFPPSFFFFPPPPPPFPG